LPTRRPSPRAVRLVAAIGILLAALLGAASPITAAASPQITIDSPAPGYHAPAGHAITATGTAASPSALLLRVRVVVKHTASQRFVTQDGGLTSSWTALDATLDRRGREAGWNLTIPGLPAGTYLIRARAIDVERNRTAWLEQTMEVTEGDVVVDDDSSFQVYADPGQGYEAATGLSSSDRFAVSVTQGGVTRDSYVYQSDNDFQTSWEGGLDYLQEANHWTGFSFDGSVEVAAERLDGKSIDTCVVRPLNLGISPTINGSSCSFTLDEPAHVSVEIDESAVASHTITHVGTVTKDIVKHPLLVFADPLEVDAPQPGDPDTTYFGPGFHDIGLDYEVPNGHTVYLAGGAVVQGTFVNADPSPNGITIRGRGILTAKGIKETATQNAQWTNHGIGFTGGGSGNLVEGITMTDGLRGAITSYSPVDVSRVKMLSWSHRNDGISVGAGSTLENLFLKVQDDSIKLYASDLVVRDVVVWQQTSGAVLKLAWSLPRSVTNNRVTDLTVIHSDVFTDYPKSETQQPELSGKSSIIASMGYRTGGATTDLVVRRLTIEDPSPHRLMALRMVSHHDGKTWGTPGANTSIDGIVFEDLVLAGTPLLDSVLYGNSAGSITGIEFRSVEVGGRTLANQADFDTVLPFTVAANADDPVYRR
jgi:hypothetical protein